MFGKIIARGHEVQACCTKPDFVDAYIWFKIFPAVICKNCGEVIGPLGYFSEKIFTLFFAPFWNGQVYVDENQLTQYDIDRITQFGNRLS